MTDKETKNSRPEKLGESLYLIMGRLKEKSLTNYITHQSFIYYSIYPSLRRAREVTLSFPLKHFIIPAKAGNEVQRS